MKTLDVKLVSNELASPNSFTVLSNEAVLDVSNIYTGSMISNPLSSSFFSTLLEQDEGFNALLNTTLSRRLAAMRDASMAGENVPIYGKNDDGELTLINLPKLSFSPITSEADSCCVVPGELQVCKSETILKELCMERCTTGIERMAEVVGAVGTDGALYAAYKQMLKNSGVKKANIPTQAQFNQLSLIAQFILYVKLCYLNGILSVEQNNNIIKKFNGFAQVYASPDVYTIDGSNGILDAMKEVSARINMIGRKNFFTATFLADRIAYAAIQEQVVPKQNGEYPRGWKVVTETKTASDGRTYLEDAYYYENIKIVYSEMMYVDSETLTGNISILVDSIGVFSAIPLDFPGEFLQKEYENPRSPFARWDATKKDAPDCWTDCESLSTMGAVVSTEANLLISVTNISSSYVPKAVTGIEGLINVNSYAPYIK